MEERGTVRVEHAGDGVEVLVLSQPRKRNAISATMMDELADILSRADDDPEVRVLVLRGEGEHFSSGGDISQSSGRSRTPESSRALLRHYLRAVRILRSSSKPVVAMVDGCAVGGAFSLVVAADLVCVSDRSRFIPAFCQRGIVPEMGMMKFLPELVGAQKAKEILFFGNVLTGRELLDLGIANRLFPADVLECETLAFARELAAMPSTSIQMVKGIMNSTADFNLELLLETEAAASPFCTTTEEHEKRVRKDNSQ